MEKYRVCVGRAGGGGGGGVEKIHLKIYVFGKERLDIFRIVISCHSDFPAVFYVSINRFRQ